MIAASAGAVAATVAGAAEKAAPAPKIQRISMTEDGGEGNNPSFQGVIASKGRYVAYLSGSSNIVDEDFNDADDVFVFDRTTGVTYIASVDSSYGLAQGASDNPSISADGRYVAFESDAANLVAGDNNDEIDVFVRDLRTETTEIVSVSSDGAAADTFCELPAISANGRYVAFQSASDTLVENSGGQREDIFVHDRVTGQTTLASVDSDERESAGRSFGPSISKDGRYVAFYSAADDLVPGDENGRADIFVRDRKKGTTILVSVDSAEAQGNDDSAVGQISGSGRYVAFWSEATNLVTGDTNGTRDIFVRDLRKGTTVRASVSSDGTEGNALSNEPAISPDGRFVAFSSNATNLVPGDQNGLTDVFVRDLKRRVTYRISVDANGLESNLPSATPTLSDKGRFAAFQSGGTALVPGDTNDELDVFVRAGQ
jgi:Tol biopolymer transport system component